MGWIFPLWKLLVTNIEVCPRFSVENMGDRRGFSKLDGGGSSKFDVALEKIHGGSTWAFKEHFQILGKITEKYLWWSSFNKVAGYKTARLQL